MKELPTEIWLLILAYLPIHYVRRLYSVNKLFFNIAMDLRYQEACIGCNSKHLSLCKNIHIFLNPLLSPHPKTLRIHMNYRAHGFFLQPVEAPKPRDRFFVERIGRSITNWTTGRKSKAGLELVPTVLDILPKLTGVMELNIIYNSKEDDPPSHDTIIFAELWKIFGDRLRSLHIHASIANLGSFLTTPLRLPSLENFSIDAAVGSTDPNELAPRLIPFLVAHQSSLRQVSIRIEHPHYFDASSTLQCLQGMPCLYSISISVPSSLIPFDGHGMLLAHQQNLKSFALYFPTYFKSLSAFFCQDWCYLKLPNLRDLVINPPKTGYCKELFDYIHLFASSLVTLTISGRWFPYKEAEGLSRKLSDFRSLRHLTLGVCGLSPPILASFARALPGLSHLVLRYHYICVDEDEHRFEGELPALFARSMRSCADLFSHWGLESFDFDADMLSNTNIKRILIDSLPNVVWFCHVERKECIRNLRQLGFIRTDPIPNTFTYLPRSYGR